MLEVFIVEDRKYEAEKRIKKLPNYKSRNVFFDLKEFYLSPVLNQIPNSDQRLNAIVFLHKNNEEATDKTPLGNPADWSTGDTLLTNITLKVCNAGGRVAVFTGGVNPEKDMESFRDTIKKHGYKEGYHFGIVSLGKIKKSSIHIAGLDEIPKDWRIDTLFEETLHQVQFHRLSLFIHSHIIPALIDLRTLQDVLEEKREEAEEDIRKAAIGNGNSGYLYKIINGLFQDEWDKKSNFLFEITHSDAQHLVVKWKNLIRELPVKEIQNPDNYPIEDILRAVETFHRETTDCLEKIKKVLEESHRES